ncbi:MAG: helix-turn-helix domain-containing protein [Gammaproteobacteria bacterium]
MRTIALPLLSTLLDLFQSRALLHLEILALRQQLAMVNQAPRKRLRFHWGQRLFWVWLYRLWPGCLQTLQVFKPDTLVRWHRKGFRLYWTWKSRCRKGGRPRIPPEVRELIRTMSRDNVGWGAPRIHGELQLLGIHVSQATVSKYMIHHTKPPSQTWRNFLNNHVKDLVSIDFFTVPTATFRILYVFLVLRHDRRVVSTST